MNIWEAMGYKHTWLPSLVRVTPNTKRQNFYSRSLVELNRVKRCFRKQKIEYLPQVSPDPPGRYKLSLRVPMEELIIEECDLAPLIKLLKANGVTGTVRKIVFNPPPEYKPKKEEGHD